MTFEEFENLVYDYGLNDRDQGMLKGLSRRQRDCVDAAWDSIGRMARHSEDMEPVGMDGVSPAGLSDGIRKYYDDFVYPVMAQDGLSGKRAAAERYVSGELSKLFPDLDLRYGRDGFRRTKDDAYLGCFDVLRKDGGEALGSLRFRYKFNPETGEFSFADKNGLGIMSGSGVLGTDAFVGYFERNGVYCQDATRYGFDTADAISREGYFVVGKNGGRPVLRNRATGKTALIADGFVPSIQDAGADGKPMPGAREQNLFAPVSHSGLRIGDKVRAVNRFPAGHTEGGISAGYVVEGVIDDFDGHDVYVRSSDEDSVFRIDRRQWDIRKSEIPGLSKGSPAVSEEKKPVAYKGDAEVSSAAVPVRRAGADSLAVDFGTPLLDKKFRMNFRENADRLLRILYGRKCPGIHVGEEVPGGACHVLFEKDGGEVEAGGFYVLHKSDVWEIRKRTPYVDSLLRGGRNPGFEPGYA